MQVAIGVSHTGCAHNQSISMRQEFSVLVDLEPKVSAYDAPRGRTRYMRLPHESTHRTIRSNGLHHH
jgi:hypothetical protein